MLDLNTAPIISHSTTAMPTFLEIMQFLKKRVRFDIESDRPFVTLDRDFLIAAIFECCLTLRLCERSPTFQKLLQLNPHFSGDLKTSLTFTHKFVIVHEVFTKLLQYDDISLTDFIQPEQKKIKGLFGALMHYANRHDFFVGQFVDA